MTLPPTESTRSPQRQLQQQDLYSDAERTRLAIAAAQRALQERSQQHHQHHSPTRTLRLTAAEQQHHQQQPHSRESTPVILRLINDTGSSSRPRSNRRRYESPLDPAEFRRESLTRSRQDTEEPRRITIRSMMAGAAVGTTARVRPDHQQQKEKSFKQGPSHRKVRRWNNDNFKNLAAEIASLSTSSADVLLQAHKDAARYRYLDPNDNRNGKSEKQMQKFMQDDEFQTMRRQFFEGELPSAASTTIARHFQQQQQVLQQRGPPRTAAEKLNQMDNRLRSVMVRACKNSMPTFAIVQQLEEYVVWTFTDNLLALNEWEEDWWKHLSLQQAPAIVNKTNDVSSSLPSKTVQFVFDAATGGFHRLLLHGICQFHGLKTVSKMTVGQDKQEKRALIVSGSLDGDGFTLTKYLPESTA